MAKPEAGAKEFVPRVVTPSSTSNLVTYQKEDEEHRRCSVVNLIVATTPMRDGRRRCIVCLEAHGSLHKAVSPAKKEEEKNESDKKKGGKKGDKEGGKKNRR